MKEIHAYFKKYYRPDNMAIILTGDLNPEEAVQTLEKYFKHLKGPKTELPTYPAFTKMKESKKVIVKGQDVPSVSMAFPLPGTKHKDILTANLVTNILYNSKVGLSTKI